MNDRTDRTDRDGAGDADDRLARILRAEADAHRPAADWDDVTRRAQAHRGRWWTNGTLGPLAAVAAALVVVLAAVLLTRDDGADTAVVADQDGAAPTTTAPTTAPPTTGTATTSPSTSTPVLPASAQPGSFTDGGTAAPLELPTGAPLAGDELVAVIEVPSEDEFTRIALVVLDVDTGEVVRTLADGFDTVEGGVYRLHVTADRRTVVYTVANSACTSRIEAVAADGTGPPVEVREEASALVVSPDGSRVATVTGDDCVFPLVIEIAPTAGGPVRRYEAPPDSSVSVESIVWSRDDAISFTTSTNDSSLPQSLHHIDLATETEDVAAGRVDGAALTRLDRAADGRVTAHRRCCDPGAPDESSIVVLDGTRVVDEITLDVADPFTVRSALLDPSGRTVVVHASEPEADRGVNTGLYVDGRLLRAAVALVAW